MANIIVCVLLIASSIFFFILTLSYPVISRFEKMGPEFWPRLMLIGIVIVTLFLLVESIMEKRKPRKTEEGPGEEKNTKLVIASGGILMTSLLLMPIIGFLLSSFIATAVLAIVLGERKKLAAFLYAFVMVLVIYVSFGKLMFVPLPRGVSIFRELSYYLY